MMSNTTRQPGYYRVKYKEKAAIAQLIEGYSNGGMRIMKWDIPHVASLLNWDDPAVIVTDPTPIDPNPASDSELQIRVRSLTNALVHIAGAPFLDVESVRFFANKFLSDIPVDPNPAPQPAGQLTAEGVEKQLKEFYTKNKDGKGSGFGLRLIKRLINEQTAAKDAEIAKLREELKAYREK